MSESNSKNQMKGKTPSLSSPLTLPGGTQIPNRVGKSAMSENLADRDHSPNEKIIRLYRTWGEGGLGLIITGNVMVDSRALGEPRNVVLETRGRAALDDRRRQLFTDWARAAKAGGSAVWMQLNHPGRQAPASIVPETVAPSAIQLQVPGGMFAKPRELTDSEIRDLARRFGESARLARDTGFDGVQIHGAHGYLVSQFLSPLANQRTDDWGGPIENRARFLFEVYDAIRSACGPNFPIGLKLNSADFQRGGFNEEDSLFVCREMEKRGLDLLEISGGTYEQAAMTGVKQRESTRKREAYFLDFCAKLRPELKKTPLMLTGGFRSKPGMESAITSGDVDLVGLARPLAVEPRLAADLLANRWQQSKVRPVKTGLDLLDKAGFLELGWYNIQLRRMATGQEPDPDLNVWWAMAQLGWEYGSQIFTRQRA